MHAAGAVVEPDLGGRADGGRHHVQAPVAIQVGDRRTPVPGGWRRGKACLAREGREFRAAQVAKHRVGLLHLRSGGVAQRLNVAARHEYVLPAIVVEIRDGGRIPGHRQAEPGHAARPGDILEAALPKVAEQRKGLVVERHEGDIREAIVIDIPEVHPHSRNELTVFGQRHAGIERHLLKLAAALVMEERIVHLVVGDEDIHEAIQIVIRDSHAHALAGVRAYAGFRRDVAESPISIVQE